MTDTRPAPYPSDTRAKGWRFELDYEKIDQSSTWALCGPEGQAWALKLWYLAWKQTPCGSLPPEEDVIAALLMIPEKFWAKHRKALMRGWWQADDGRLYHDTIAATAHRMLAKRAKDARRAADRRAKHADAEPSPPEDTPESRVTRGGVGSEFDTKHQAPSTSSPAVKKSAKAPPPACPEDVDPQVWTDWVKHRAKKRADVSPTTIDGARAEALKAGITFEAFLRLWCVRGSQGMSADWIKPPERAQFARVPDAEPAWRTEQRERNREALGPFAAKNRQPNNVIDITPTEGHDAPASLLG